MQQQQQREEELHLLTFLLPLPDVFKDDIGMVDKRKYWGIALEKGVKDMVKFEH